MKRYLFFVGGLGLAVLVLAGTCGCGDNPGANRMPSTSVDLPSDLQTMQGDWICVSTNTYHLFHISIQDYLFRLSYQKTPDDPLFKQNSSFESIDEQRRALIMHDNSGGCRYNILQGDEGELLEIEVYSDAYREWLKVILKREA
ncbi:MAG: hypothetical protein K9M45_00625 [Kiritimatiellales bacterium]|nr:hypothetical protein [Kiritimatiellales bacterium]